MIEILTGLAVTSDEESELATPRGVRLALGALLRQSAPGVPVAGRIYAPNDSNGREPLQVDGDDSEVAYWVNAGVAVTAREGQFGYLVGNPLRAKLEAPTPDGTHPRIDIIFICQPDKEQSDASSQAYLDVASGTPAGTPEAPSLPPGSLELARKRVEPGATNTAEGAAFTNIAPMTYVNSGPIDASDVVSGAFAEARIPNLPASRITSGAFDAARIPNLPASRITSGAFDAARIPNLNASKVTAGVLAAARVPKATELRGISYGTAAPSGGSDGDIYLRLV